MRRVSDAGDRIRVLFLIRSLVPHGAERQLAELVKGLDKAQFSVTVVTFYDGGAMRREIEDLEGVQIVSLGKRARWDLLAFLRLLPIVREVRPHVVHGYMGTSNELALVAGKTVGARVVWGLRRSESLSDLDPSQRDWTDVVINPMAAWMSRFADLIISNSEAGKRSHLARGYCPKRVIVIPNGIDTVRFRPDSAAGNRLRCAWGIVLGARVVGLVGRLHPCKDHPTFLQAAGLLAQWQENIRFVCIGDGPEDYGRKLQALARELGLEDRLIWAGALDDMPAAYNALDLLVCASVAEGFSNVIGEAMACGVPCVVTDVGDSAAIVENRERVVAPRDPHALAAACVRLLDLPEERMSTLRGAVREQIVERYSVQRLVRSTESALLQLVQGRV